MGLKDMKEGLRSARKADITHVRMPMLVYASRACEYGSVKYERSNFLRPTGDGGHTKPTKADFERLRGYLRAGLSHTVTVLDAMEAHQAGDPQLLDVAGMKRAAYCEDTDVTPGQAVGASLLPHLCGALASFNMALAQAVACGLLPADPGRPWEVTQDRAAAVEKLAQLGVLPMTAAAQAQMGDEGASAAALVKSFAPKCNKCKKPTSLLVDGLCSLCYPGPVPAV